MRILIDSKNAIFSSTAGLTSKNNQYNFSFYEEETTKDRGNFVFDENNDNFQLTPINTPTPIPNNNPNSDKVEEEFTLVTPETEYIRLCNNLKSGD
jgi:hypothetical protein